MAWEAVKDEFTIERIGARLLPNLARGIYNHEAVLREYVQNARDAYFDLWDFIDSLDSGDKYADLPTNPENAPIRIRLIDPTAISIQDNAIGMDEDEIRESMGIALDTGKAEKSGRAGFRGIGIWAGFQACDQLELMTKKIDVPYRYRLIINFKDIRQHVLDKIDIKKLLDKRYHIQRERAEKDEHYTIVKLVGLHGDHEQLANLEELQRIASQILPCRIDPEFEHTKAVQDFLARKVEEYREFPIFVQNDEVLRRFPSGLDEPQFASLEKDGEVYGWAWYCTGDQSLKPRGFEYRSFRLRIQNLAVGRNGIFDDEDGSAFGITGPRVKLSSAAHLNWHMGELHITHPDIVPDTPRSSLELDSTSRKAIDAIRGFYEDRIAESRARASLNTYCTKAEASETLLNNTDAIDIEQAEQLLTYLKEQDALTRGPRPKDKAKQKVRELLTKDALKTKRRQLIRKLEKVAGTVPTPTGTSRSSPRPEVPPASRRFSRQGAIPAPASTGATRTVTNFEQVLSDVFAVLQSKLGDDVELYAEVCTAVESVFRAHGLTNA